MNQDIIEDPLKIILFLNVIKISKLKPFIIHLMLGNSSILGNT